MVSIKKKIDIQYLLSLLISSEEVDLFYTSCLKDVKNLVKDKTSYPVCCTIVRADDDEVDHAQEGNIVLQRRTESHHDAPSCSTANNPPKRKRGRPRKNL